MASFRRTCHSACHPSSLTLTIPLPPLLTGFPLPCVAGRAEERAGWHSSQRRRPAQGGALDRGGAPPVPPRPGKVWQGGLAQHRPQLCDNTDPHPGKGKEGKEGGGGGKGNTRHTTTGDAENGETQTTASTLLCALLDCTNQQRFFFFACMRMRHTFCITGTAWQQLAQHCSSRLCTPTHTYRSRATLKSTSSA